MDTEHPISSTRPAVRPRVGLAIASLVLGLLAVFTSILLVGAVVAALAILLGLVHISKRRGPNALAWVGIGLAFVGLVLSGGFGFLYFKGVQAATGHLGHALEQSNDESGDADSEFSAWIGRPAPDFTVTSIDGERLTLSDLRGRRVVLDFWATWCPPCRREIPHFVRLTDEQSRDNLVIIGISDEPTDVLAKFAEENGMNYPIVSAQNLPAPFGSVVAIPTTFIVDRNGVIQTALVGYHDYEHLKRVALAEDHSAQEAVDPAD